MEAMVFCRVSKNRIAVCTKRMLSALTLSPRHLLFTTDFDLLYHFLSLQAYELSTLTGTQVMLLVASETGHVYTFATPKLQPMITSEAGKALIQTCLHTPEHSQTISEYDMRMSVSGYEETDLGYSMNEDDGFKVC